MKNLVYITIILMVFLFSKPITASEPMDVTIIEIGAYEKSGYEYIKIYNNTDEDINLDSWKFTENFSNADLDGTNHSLKEFNRGYTLLSKKEGVITQDPLKFLENHANYQEIILDSSWSSLNESGEKIQLLDNEDNIVESFTYLPCPDAALKRTIFSLADYSANNWREDITTTNLENSQEVEPTENNTNTSESLKNSTTIKPKIIINEILPNPPGQDTDGEFIELKNTGDTTINLNNWQLQNNNKNIYNIYNEYYTLSFIRPNQFFVIYRNQSKMAMNNNTDTIKLYDDKGDLIDSVSYSKAIENISYARNLNKKWEWTDIVTPDKANIILPKNNAPIITIEYLVENNKVFFDASDSYDPDKDDIFFMWDFGDGNSSTLVNPANTYTNNGIHEITLSVFDTKDASSKSTIKITIDSENNKSVITDTDDIQSILISEILPNPAGSDDTEFIEIYNPHQNSINLKNWSLADNSKKEPWVITDNTIIGAEEYLVFYKTDTKISLNNTNDSVKLLDPNNNIISEITYDKAKEAMSYSLNVINNEWAWNYNITPDEDNEIIVESAYNNYPVKLLISSTSDYQNIDLIDIKDYELGSFIETTGIVTAPPGLLGKQIFYLNGIQVYMYSQNFPELKIGDVINVKGELTEAKKELRIKVKNIEDIKLTANNQEINIIETYIEDIDDSLLGKLIKINGEITEHKSDTLWIDDDTAELKVYLNQYTGIKIAKTEPGQTAEIIGILSNSSSGYRLLPRYQEDIKIGQVLGEKIYEPAIQDNEPSKTANKYFNKYIITTLIALLIIISRLFFKYYKKTETNI